MIAAMSYPPNYGYGVPPPVDPRTPGRRAAILMWVLGGISLTCGGLLIAFAMVPPEDYPPEIASAVQEAEAQLGLPFAQYMLTQGSIATGFAFLAIVLAFFVWRSGRIACGLALVVAGLAALLQILGIVGTAMQSGGNPSQLFGAMCVNGVLLAIFGLLMSWLVQAIRNAPLVQAMRAGQAWAGGGYPPQGYGHPQAWPGPYPSGGYPPTNYPPGAPPPPPAPPRYPGSPLPPPPPPPRNEPKERW